jgi:ribosomal-protein-alanine N-acetyltransferase
VYPFCRVVGPRVMLRPFALADVEALTAVQQANRQTFEPYMPVRSEEFFTLSAQRKQILFDGEQWAEGRGFSFAIEGEEGLAGRVALSNVVRGAWQSATLGYWVDARQQGRGYATEAVGLVVTAAFEHFELHRVQAAIMPKNGPSLKVIEKARFYFEGMAPFYLNINGQWEDHRIFSLTREQYAPDACYVREPALL